MTERVFFNLPSPRELMQANAEQHPEQLKVVPFPAFWQLHKAPYLNWYCDDTPLKAGRGMFAGIPVVRVTYTEYIKFRIVCILRWIYGYNFSPEHPNGSKQPKP